MQRSALCRSRRELSNEYLLAKFGFDTAEKRAYLILINFSSLQRFNFDRALASSARLAQRRGWGGEETDPKWRGSRFPTFFCTSTLQKLANSRQMLRTLADVLADGDMVQLDQVVCPLEHAGGIAQIGIFAGL